MINSFQPRVPTSMDLKSSDVYPRLLAAVSRPAIGHLDPAIIAKTNEYGVDIGAALREELSA